METNQTVDKDQIAIHAVPSVTRDGHLCKKYPKFLVVVGKNPHGPFGGHCGNWGDGIVVAKFSRKIKAQEFVETYKL